MVFVLTGEEQPEFLQTELHVVHEDRETFVHVRWDLERNLQAQAAHALEGRFGEFEIKEPMKSMSRVCEGKDGRAGLSIELSAAQS